MEIWSIGELRSMTVKWAPTIQRYDNEIMDFRKNLFFDKICPRIYKNGLIHRSCTILKWDNCQ